MFAGAAKIDITPSEPVGMDGMIREHGSLGVHDPLFARCLALSNSSAPQDAHLIISVDVCALDAPTVFQMRKAVAATVAVRPQRVIVAATHTHSGPATFGFFSAREEKYNEWLVTRIAGVASATVDRLQPAEVAWGAAQEYTISHYRRLLARDGHVVMNWEPYPPGQLVGPLGVADSEVSVLSVTAQQQPHRLIALLFGHAGHPNVMSGDNYLLSSDYPGFAARLLDERLGTTAIFVNGAQGSVDIDGLRDRDWAGVARAGTALAEAAEAAQQSALTATSQTIRDTQVSYCLPARKLTVEEWTWAQGVLQRTGGRVESHADGIGEDYLAVLYRSLRAAERQSIDVEQTCLAIGDGAIVTFPGELYTEIGLAIKARSPFRKTTIVGLANGYVGYIPTRKAITEGGYSEDTRRVDAAAEDIIMQRTLALLQSAWTAPTNGGERI